jgi:hypothetical protein
LGLRIRYRILIYIILSIILGLIFTAGFANWIGGESGEFWNYFWIGFPWFMILGFFLGTLFYCYVMSEAGL